MDTFLDEILSQGEALENCYNSLLYKQKNSLIAFFDYFHSQHIRKIIFTGMGSSFYCTYVPFIMLRQAGFEVDCIEAGEFLLHGFPLTEKEVVEKTVIILISQSGQTGEIVELVKKIQNLKIKPYMVGITNNVNSFLAEHTDLQLFLDVGSEVSVTSKTYVGSLLLLYILARFIITKNLNSENERNMIKHLITNVKQFLNSNKAPSGLFDIIDEKFGNDYQFIQILARGPSLSTAYQGALNFKEIVKIASEATTVSAFRHGGIESLNEHTRLILFTSTSVDNVLNNQFINQLTTNWKFGRLLYITNQDLRPHERLLLNNPNIIFYRHNIENPFLAPIQEILFLQFMCYKTALKRGHIPGKFIFSSKITRGL